MLLLLVLELGLVLLLFILGMMLLVRLVLMGQVKLIMLKLCYNWCCYKSLGIFCSFNLCLFYDPGNKAGNKGLMPGMITFKLVMLFLGGLG